MSQDVNIKELNERIKKESEFVDLITLEIQKVIIGQKSLVERLLILPRVRYRHQMRLDRQQLNRLDRQLLTQLCPTQ